MTSRFFNAHLPCFSVIKSTQVLAGLPAPVHRDTVYLYVEAAAGPPDIAPVEGIEGDNLLSGYLSFCAHRSLPLSIRCTCSITQVWPHAHWSLCSQSLPFEEPFRCDWSLELIKAYQLLDLNIRHFVHMSLWASVTASLSSYLCLFAGADVDLSCAALDPSGPFSLVQALRPIAKDQHTHVRVRFNPSHPGLYFDVLELSTAVRRLLLLLHSYS
jgi:hypothetical protein